MVPLVTFQIFTWVTGSLYEKPAGWLTRLSASYAATFGAWPLATGSRVGSATAPLPPLAPVAVLSQPSDARTPASATASTAGTRGRSETGTSMAKVWSESRSSSVMPVTRHPRLGPYRSVAPLRIQFPSSARSWSVIAVTFPSGMVWVTTATARIRSARADPRGRGCNPHHAARKRDGDDGPGAGAAGELDPQRGNAPVGPEARVTGDGHHRGRAGFRPHLRHGRSRLRTTPRPRSARRRARRRPRVARLREHCHRRERGKRCRGGPDPAAGRERPSPECRRVRRAQPRQPAGGLLVQ